jgi:hypothetical protein
VLLVGCFVGLLSDFEILEETINAYINRKKDNDLHFSCGYEKFAF